MTDAPAGRLSRRRLLSATATSALAVGVAGCSSGDGDGGGSGDLDPMGTVTGTIDGIEVVDLNSYMGGGQNDDGERFSVDVTVENTGDETIEPLGYTYELRLLTENGDEAYRPSLGASANDHEIAPGETGSVTTWNANATDEEKIDSYEIAVTCDGSFADGVYCE